MCIIIFYASSLPRKVIKATPTLCISLSLCVSFHIPLPVGNTSQLCTEQAREQLCTGEAREQLCTGEAREQLCTGQAREQLCTGQAREQLCTGQAREQLCTGEAREQLCTGEAREQLCTGQAREQLCHSVLVYSFGCLRTRNFWTLQLVFLFFHTSTVFKCAHFLFGLIGAHGFAILL